MESAALLRDYRNRVAHLIHLNDIARESLFRIDALLLSNGWRVLDIGGERAIELAVSYGDEVAENLNLAVNGMEQWVTVVNGELIRCSEY